MTGKARWIGFLIMAGCLDDCPRDPVDPPKGDEWTEPDPELLQDRVVLAVEGPCPRPNQGWQSLDLLAAIEDLQQDDPDPERICIFDRDNPGVKEAAFAGVERLGTGVEVVRLQDGRSGTATFERLAIVGQTGWNDDVVRGAYVDAFTWGAGLPVYGRPRAPEELPLVVVLDSTPSTEGAGDHHGDVIVGMMRAIQAGGDPWFEIGAVQVLGTRGPLEFGGVSELAQGILQVVQRGVARTPVRPVILNLSLGWNPNFLGRHGVADPEAMGALGRNNQVDPAKFAPDVRAVWKALAKARCAGFPVFAATGNLAGPSGEGFLLPAAWEGAEAPDCPRVPVVDNEVKPASLVQAVGAWGLEGALGIERPASEAALVSWGDHVQWKSGNGTAPTVVMSGTSAATAVVSAAAAALAWPDPDGGRSMPKRLYDASRETPTGEVDRSIADAAARQYDSVQGVYVKPCRALESIDQGRYCPDPTPLPTFPAPPEITEVMADWEEEGLDAPACGARKVVVAKPPGGVPYTIDEPCPSATVGGADLRPVVLPAPIWNGCPVCVMSISDVGRVTLQIGGIGNYADYKSLVVSAMLESGTVVELVLPPQLWPPGDATFTLRKDGGSAATTVRRAYLTGTQMVGGEPMSKVWEVKVDVP